VVVASVVAHDEPVVLVGWSLGGYIACEYAREHPRAVRKIVTLGSPVIGGPPSIPNAMESWRGPHASIDGRPTCATSK
jgi:pimeloyl-ACP methyl ester carboxylesterase